MDGADVAMAKRIARVLAAELRKASKGGVLEIHVGDGGKFIFRPKKKPPDEPA